MSEIAEESVVSTATVEAGGDDSALYGDDVLSLFTQMEESDAEEGAEGAEAEAQSKEGENAPENEAEGEIQHPDYPVPDGWEAAMWQGAAPELRGKVDSMVKAHAEALAAKEKAMQEAEALHREQAMKANAEMQTSLGIMRRVVEGEFAGINWQELAKSDPAMYVELQAQYQQRVSAIQQMQQSVAAQSAQIAQAQAAEAQKAMEAELASCLPKVKALVGAGYTADGFRNELTGYLQKSGVPAEAIGAISKGYELELATKAMLYDRFMEAKASASAKVADAPKVQAPRGAKSAGEGDALAKARARLDKNPNRGDNITALFEAMYNGG